MRICPKCKTIYPSPSAEVCVRDGAVLVEHARFLELENDPLRGKLIGGRYRVTERVGQGGMGTVYRAEQAGLNRPVAIKILRQELNLDPDTVARFHREANAMSKLTHANTVRVYDFGQTDEGLFFLVMELLEGELLTQKMAREGPLSLFDAIHYTQQILRSLAEAHSQGIVHRDLKPDNIFLARVEGHGSPMVKVVDFGIAKVVANDLRVDQFETQAGTVFGTPRYMSPEQAQGVSLDARSDLYTVGTLLYQMVTGRPPFVDDDAVVVMAKHIREAPEAPSDVASDRTIPSRLEAAIMTALEKDPLRRFPSAAAFDRALEDCLDDALLASGLPARRPSSLRLQRWLVSLVLAGIALGAVAFSLRSVRFPELFDKLRRTPVVRAPEASPTGSSVEPVEQRVPTKIRLRSAPTGAWVWRDGKQLGRTPLSLWVDPDTDLVRVELRKPGFQPLVAEVAATEGERTLELVALAKRAAPAPASAKPTTAKPRPRPGPGRVRGTPPAGRTEPKAPATPEPDSKSSGPYERFD